MHCCIGCISAIEHSRIIQGRHPWRSGKIGETRIKMRIKFDEPIIGKDNVLEIDSKDLDDFYVSASDTDRMNLFFILLTSLHYYEGNGDTVRAAHLSFLVAYYAFTPLTPPGSHYLALHYMNKAISLNPLLEYNEWLVVMEKGN